jgi:3D (Asp-Asp-Asp) domain-containing protein
MNTFMKTKKKKIPITITLTILTLLFFASQDVQESVPEANFLHDQLWEVIDSLEKELTGYKEREMIFLRSIAHEEYMATAYLPIDPMEGRHSGLTATGVSARPYLTVAVDPKVIPLNSWIWIDSLGWWKAQDTGSAIRGKKIDLCLSAREKACEFGVRKMRIKILK